MFGTIFLFGLVCLLFVGANISERNRQLEQKSDVGRFMAFAPVIFVLLMLLVCGVITQVAGMAIASDPGAFWDAFNETAELQNLPEGLETEMRKINFMTIALGLWLPAILGLLAFVPTIRYALSRMMPLDPEHRVQTLALAMAPLALVQTLVLLGIGLDTLAELLAEAESSGSLIGSAWVQNAMFVLLSMVGVGWLTRRNFADTLDRLKIKTIGLKEILIGIGAGIGLLIVMGGLLQILDSLGFSDPAVEELSELLYGDFFSSLAGVLTVGLAAGIGEEALFRGALQPRFGRLTAAFIFAIVHANYGLSPTTLAIFIVGYALGYLRDRYSTTVSMVTHASFNSIQAFGAWLLSQNPEWIEQFSQVVNRMIG